MSSTPRGHLRGAVLLVAVTLSACGSAPSTARAPSSPLSAASTEGSATRPTPATVSAAAATLATCEPPRDPRALHVVHHFSVSPDDVTVDGRGRLWVTAREADQLIGMSSTGGALSVATVPGGPEGVVGDASGLYVAQQNLNSIVAVGPPMRTVLVLPNRTRNAGVDGIGLDTGSRRLLIPDSPSGQLLVAAVTGAAAPRVLAEHLGRPVAATMDPHGDVVVASESSPGLTVVSPAGVKRPLGHFTDLDEVVWYAGLLYVTELDRHDVVAVDPVTGASAPVAVGLPAPQGLAVTAAGLLEIVDATTNTLYSTPACGVTP